MGQLQSSYAESIKDLGIKRGISGSSARHQDIRKMYANLNNAINIPDPKQGETAEEYKTRFLENFQTIHAAGMRKVDDYAVRTRQQLDQERNTQRENMELELKHSRRAIKKLKEEKNELEEQCSRSRITINNYQDMISELAQQMYDIKTNIDQTPEAAEAVDYYRKIQSGLKRIESYNPEHASEIRDNISEAITIGEQQTISWIKELTF